MPKGRTTLSLKQFNENAATLTDYLPTKPGDVARIHDYSSSRSLTQGAFGPRGFNGPTKAEGNYRFGSPRGVGEWGIFEASPRDEGSGFYRKSFDREQHDEYQPRYAEPAPFYATGPGQKVPGSLLAPARREYGWQPADSSAFGADSQKTWGVDSRNNVEPFEESLWNQTRTESETMAKAAMAKLSIGGIRSSLLAAPNGPLVNPVAVQVAEQNLIKPADVAAIAPVDDGNSDPAQRRHADLLPRNKAPSPPARSDGPSVDAVDRLSAAAAAASDARPKLQLLPRSKPPAGAKDPSSGSVPKTKPSIFGAARPREEVLKERGVDPSLAIAPALGHGPSGGDGYRHGSRPGSVHSGTSEEAGDQWHVISNGRPRAPSGGRSDRPGGYDELDPFFGGKSAPLGRGYCGSAYEFSASGGHNGHGAYGAGADDDDGPMFRRPLPTRSDLF